MKTVGLLGGMSWESSAQYYRLLNEGVREHLGGLHSAKVLMHSVDFAELEPDMRADDWDALAEKMLNAARSVEAGGAQCLLICTNTGHKLADHIADHIDIPLINLLDVVAQRASALGLERVGLLGTAYTMEQDFYVRGLAQRGLTPVIPDPTARTEVNRIIFEELVVGRFDDQSRRTLAGVADGLGTPGVVLGCTELELLLRDGDVDCQLLPTTRLHVEAALDWALA